MLPELWCKKTLQNLNAEQYVINKTLQQLFIQFWKKLCKMDLFGVNINLQLWQVLKISVNRFMHATEKRTITKTHYSTAS